MGGPPKKSEPASLKLNQKDYLGASHHAFLLASHTELEIFGVLPCGSPGKMSARGRVGDREKMRGPASSAVSGAVHLRVH